ncbi:MAG: 3-hydroxyacyl-CoA dehydrogenase [Terrimesophilobacter sp.]
MKPQSIPDGKEPDLGIQSVGVVGAGSIGIAWTIVFATAGLQVRLFELDHNRRESALVGVESILCEMYEAELLLEPVQEVMTRVSIWETLAETVDGVGYVLECVVENLDVKRELFSQLDQLTPEEVVLASSTSAIPVSKFASDLKGRDRCLVVHPANPPYFLRVAEVVPAEFTSRAAVAQTISLLTRAKISPVVLNQEIEGFAFNRLQGALLREAYCLVRDGVISPVDLDTLVRKGLGLRWSVIGPFTTSELNTRGGLRQHSELLGPVYARFGLDRGNENPWTSDTIERVADDIRQHLPHVKWEENVRERDHAMIQLSSLLKGFENPFGALESE